MEYRVKRYLVYMRYAARTANIIDDTQAFFKAYVDIGYSTFVGHQQPHYRQLCMDAQSQFCNGQNGFIFIYNGYIKLDLTSKIGNTFRRKYFSVVPEINF